MREFINGLTKSQYDFMFSDPIYPEDYYEEATDEESSPEVE